VATCHPYCYRNLAARTSTPLNWVLCALRHHEYIEMAISEFETKRCERELEKFLEIRRPPPHIRDKLDIGYRMRDQSIEIFEIRSQWNKPDNKIEQSVAKTTYVKSKKHWKVFWQRADMEWHGYDPCPTVRYLEDFLTLVNEDAHACFFG